MIEPSAVSSSITINYDRTEQAPKSGASKLSQISQPETSRAKSTVNLATKGNILVDIAKSGGLRALTGYKPSLVSYVSNKISDAVNAFKGRQVAFDRTDRNGITTFRALERLAANARNTALTQNDSPQNKAAHREAIVEFRDALQQYVNSKPGRLDQDTAILSGLDTAIAQLDLECTTVSVAITPEVSFLDSEDVSHVSTVTSDEASDLNGKSIIYASVSTEKVQSETSDRDDGFKIESTEVRQGSWPEGKLEQTTESEMAHGAFGTKQSMDEAPFGIIGITEDQETRLQALCDRAPLKALEVVLRSKGNATDLDLILDNADVANFETRSVEELVASKRAKLTDPESKGGLGIDPKDLKFKKLLGEGEFGAVALYEYQDPDTKKIFKFAGKVATNSDDEALEQEEAMLARLPEHGNLVKSFGIHQLGEERVLLQEFVSGGSLSSVIEALNWDSLTAQQQQTLFKHVAGQVFSGLLELQKLGIAHDDVRADNLLFDPETLNIKLGDFGLASDRGVVVKGKLYPVRWTSPEIISKHERRVSVTGDTFSASRVLVGELVRHFNLFNTEGKNKGLLEMRNAEVKNALKQEATLPDKLPAETRKALDRIDHTGKLADFFEAISHPDPEKRLRANQALNHAFFATPLTREELIKIFEGVFPQLSNGDAFLKDIIYE